MTEAQVKALRDAGRAIAEGWHNVMIPGQPLSDLADYDFSAPGDGEYIRTAAEIVGISSNNDAIWAEALRGYNAYVDEQLKKEQIP